MNERTSQESAPLTPCDCSGSCEECQCTKDGLRQSSPQIVPFSIVTTMIWLLMLCVTVWGQTAGPKTGGPGLLIIAHGSPSQPWNQKVMELEPKIRDAFGDENPFVATKVVFMEFAEPNVAAGVEALQSAGCSRIVAVPLLIAPSSHSHWDIPALLGIYSDAAVEKELRAEGLRVARPRIPVTLTTTLAESDVIEKIMLKRVRQLSSDPGREAIVLLAHGSEAIPPAWERWMKRTVTYICGRTGISYGDWATVGVGQEYQRAVAAIQEAAEHRERVIVVGAYLSMGVTRMHGRWTERAGGHHGAEAHTAENPLEGLNVQLSEQGLLPDGMVTQWIVDTARGEIQRHPSRQ